MSCIDCTCQLLITIIINEQIFKIDVINAERLNIHKMILKIKNQSNNYYSLKSETNQI